MKRSRRSLRGRLVLGAVAVSLVFAAVFGVLATLRLHQVEDTAVGTALRTRLDLVRDEVRGDGTLRPDRGSPQADLVQVVGPSGRVLSASPALAGVAPLVPLSDVRAHGPVGTRRSLALQHPDIDLAVLAVPVPLSASAGSPAGTGMLAVALDAEGFTAARSDLLAMLLVGLIAVVAVMAVLAWVLAGRALRDVTRITEEAEGIGPADLHAGLPVPVDDAELARLVGALNRMLHRLHESHSRELAFAADAGHRLRTPVATLRAEAELALREEDRGAQLDALGRILGDADRLTLIVDRMLARHRRVSRTAGEQVRCVLEASSCRWTRQAHLAGVTLELALPADLPDDLTCAVLSDVVEPLVDNALRHTPFPGTVRVSASLDDDGTCLAVEVTNSGPGVALDLAPHVFDAWVSGRDASVAGGLGLWLAREAARDAGGEVSLVDPSPGHTTFRGILPVHHDVTR